MWFSLTENTVFVSIFEVCVLLYLSMIFGVYLRDRSEICMKTFCTVLRAQLNTAVCF